MNLISLSAHQLISTSLVLLAVGLSVAAVRRANRQRLALRLVAGWAAAAGLWGLAYPPTRAVPVSRHEAIILTADYQPDTLRQLLRQLGTNTPVWHYDGRPTSDTPTLHSLLALRERAPALRRVHVLGRGLPPAALAEAGPLPLVAHRDAPVFVGFVAAQWNRQLTLGQTLEVRGRFATPTSRMPTWVVLRAAGRGQDSVQLATDGAFRLRYQPKATGLTTYELRARRGAATVAREPVPAEVGAAPPLRVLLLASVPGFEFRFLKDHLAARQHAVALRVQVSRGLTQTDFLNQPAHDLRRLTPALLARYDALIVDAGALAALSGAEVRALQTAVQRTGLGLILLPDPTGALPRALPARAKFAVLPRAATDRPQLLRWPDGPPNAAALLPASLRLRGAEALVTDARQQPMVGTARVGAGRVAVSTVAATFSWLLQQPQAATYDAFWSRLLTAVARPMPEAVRWQVLTPWPRPHAPVTLRLETGRLPPTSPTVAQAGQPPVPLALRQDTRLPEWRTAPFWPAAAGWHRAQLPSRPDHWFYVFAADAWPGPEAAQRRQAAARLAARPTSAGPTEPLTAAQPWPAGWFLALFLVGAGLLWLEEKL